MVKILTERVRHILHEHLSMEKVSARWVPRSLTIDQKQQRVDDSEHTLALFQCNCLVAIKGKDVFLLFSRA